IMECSSKADLIEIQCRTKDPCQDKWYQSDSIQGDGEQIEKIGASESAVVDEN
ncbi:hypothetical protein Tco_0401068, partial [Tanacetum coccineum]